ncbi:Ig-like domain-containing protein [Rosenbergiella epipactidis]|uniref:Ig-like domain-containing protein n=1 Tax=Rosenbergiella epipactidis TaxID=1544694 RepID=UPI002026AFB0|nr:Ig-like domain-containing protein [Rosenbergiella epipactidis]
MKTFDIDVIARKTAEKSVLHAQGNMALTLTAPSVVEIHGQAQDVVKYIRQGKDLLIYMKDGSVIRCNGYFVEDAQSHAHSELVFNDNNQLTHISFDDVAEGTDLSATPLVAHSTPIDSIEPFMAQEGVLSDLPWGWIAGAAVGGGALGALLSSGGGHSKTKVIDNTQPVEKATPTFTVTDNQGDKQGLVATQSTIDDNTPTFSGTGEPGATIQIKDGEGNTIASTMVDSKGTWTVNLPTQTDGAHSWSVTQIDGSASTSAGSIDVTIVTAKAQLVVNTIAGDNQLNADEHQADVTISGLSQQLAEGTPVTVSINGKNYTASVDSSGQWSVVMPADDAKALTEGNWTVTVTATDSTGNQITQTQNITVDTQAPTLTLDTVAGDQVVNAAEHQAALTLAGTSNAASGSSVTVIFGAQTYQATVDDQGKWQVSVPAETVNSLKDGDYSYTASITDSAGNTATASSHFVVDTASPVITIDTFAGDDVVNSDEQQTAQLLTGKATGAAAGDIVKVTIGDTVLNGVVAADGTWSVGVPAAIFASLAQGQHSAAVSITDTAGNTGTATHDFTLSGAAPTLSIEAISQDNVINASEALQPLALSGKSNLADGTVVTVTLNHVDYQATVAQGVWKITVPATDVMHLDNTLYTVTVTGTDSAGNPGSAQATVLVDTHLPQVTIDAFATDNLVNHEEIAVDQTLSGRVVGAAAGDQITVSLGGKTYTTTVEKDLTWHTAIPAADMAALGDGKIAIDVSVTNAHGNTGENSLGIDINAQLPGLRIDTVSGDDVINALEQQQDLTVTGNSEHLDAGTIISVTVNQIVYSAVVEDQGHWQIGIPAADMANWPAGALTITATASDAYGNNAAITHPITVDNDQVALTIDTVSSDDMINAAEQQQALVLSGKTQHVEAGQSVIIKFAGQLFTAQVEQDGSWHVTVPASAMSGLTEGHTDISATVTNLSGNSSESSRTITVDTQPPSITIDTVTADNLLNASEAQQPLMLSGASTAEAGQTVTVSLGGKEYTATVDKQGHWQVSVPADDLAALPQGQNAVTATVADISGNPSSASHDFAVDTVVPVVTINTLAGDDVINAAEHHQAQILSGSATGAAAGDTVTITLNGQTYTAILDAQGQWSTGIPSSAIAALQEGKTEISVTVTDKAGNTGTATHDVTVDTQDPALVFATIATDDVVNADEHQSPLTLSGQSSDLAEGTTVTVTLAGKSYTTTTDNQGNWSVTLTAQETNALPEGQLSVSASATNDVGNTVTTSTTLTVDTHLPTVSINTTAGDDVINASELAAGQTLSGQVSGAVAGDTVTVLLGGNRYTATVAKDLTWSIKVSSDDLTAMGNGPLTVDASVTNQHGNTGHAQHAISIDANLPGLRVNTVAGDDIINTIEHGQNLLVTGSSQGLTENSTLTITIDGKTYSANVMADGSWSAAVPSSDVSTWPAGNLQIAVSGESSAGNPVNILHPVTVDLADVAISINTVSRDDVLNAAEKGQDLALSGSTHDVAVGSDVTITFAGHQYSTTVDSEGNWAITVPAANMVDLADGTQYVEVSVTTPAGNSAQAGREIQVDTVPPSLTIDNLTQDNVLNAQESANDQLISGSSTAQAGQEVTVSLKGKEYKATVDAQGHWQVKVPATDLQALSEGETTLSVTVADKAGNSTQAEHSFTVDAQAPVVTIDKVAGDDIINIDEHSQAQIISGSATGGAAGNTVAVTIDGKTYTTVLDEAGKWSIGVPASVISSLQDGKVSIDVTVTDNVGNIGKASHDITVDTGLPSITINSVTSDNVINAAEKGQDLTLSGSTSHIEPGNTVVIAFAGKSYSVVVDAKGNWTLYVPSSALADLKEGSAQVQVSVHNDSGNSAQASHDFIVDSAAPMLQLDPVSTNNVLNAQEAQQPLTLTGTTSAQAGQTVTVTFNNKQYSATVETDGSWSVTVPQEDVAALQDGQYKVSASVENIAGNSSTSASDLLVDITAPATTIATVAGDDIINATEHSQALMIQGVATGTQAGDAVAVTLNGKTYNVVVDAQGQWSLGIPATDVSAMNGGDYQIIATVTDRAGNSQSTTHEFHVDLTTPVLSINTIAGDDIINSTEKGQDITITGQATGVNAGATVTVMLNGQSYTATVDDKGNWSTVVPAAEVANLGEANYAVTASATNEAGNSATTSHSIAVGTQTPLVIINTVAGDDVINASELAAGQTLSGKVSGAAAGDTVTVQLGGNTYTATVANDLTWSLKVSSDDLTALGNGALTVEASVTNKTGNTGHAEHAISIDANLPGVRVDTVAGDDILNTIEHNQNLIVTGSSQGIAANSALTVTINGKTYSATVLADGSWQAAVPSSDVSAWAAGTVQIAVSGESSAGNPVAILHPVTVDLAEVAISIDTVSGDDVLNAAEKGQDLALSGSTHDVAEGCTVTVKLAGHQYSTTVGSDGNWSVTVPAADMSGLYDGLRNVEVSVTTPTGNSAQAGREILVDTVAPSLTIDNLTQDNVLNAKEAGSDQLISGSSTAQAGQTVTVSLNGKDYQTTVDAQGHWQLSVPAADLQALTDGQTTITASVADKAGNSTEATHNVQVDLQAPVITVDKVAEDDVINVAEHSQAQIISGSVTGGEAGNTVVVTLAGKTYTTVLDASGHWTVGVPASVIAGLQDGSVSIAVSVTDSAGNVGSTSHDIKVDTGLPTLSINTIAGDDIINSTEKGQDLTITGQATGLASGTTVTVSLNGHQYSATVDDKGNWSTIVPAADVANLGEAIYSVSASASNDVGNIANTVHAVTVGTQTPLVIINTVAGDDVINASELAAGQTLSGKVSGAAAGDTVTVHLGGNTYTATVANDLTWSIKVSSDDLTAMGNGALTVEASVTNKTGNTGHAEHAISIDANLPGLRVDTVAGDDILNTIEHNQNLIVTGSSQGIAANSVLTVTINGKTYSATVLADGSWQAAVPSSDVSAWAAGTVQITVSGESSAGNPVSILHPVTVDLAEVAISINTVSGDDVLNAAEKGQDLALSGSTHEAAEGSTVTVKFAGHQYSTTVDSEGNWSVTVPAADMSGLYDGLRNVEVSVTTPTGNSAQAGREILVDTVAPSLTIDNLTQDNVLNAKEAGSDQLISGSSTAQAGQTVTVSLNGKDYQTTVDAQGHWQLSVPAADLQVLNDGQTTITASVADKAGNNIEATHNVQVDLQAPVITVDKVAEDDVINVTEHSQAQIISGSVTGGEAGNTVVVTLAGKTYTTVLDASGNWTVGVPASVIAGLQDGSVSIAVSVTDSAGNVGSTSHDIKVDTGLPTLSINTIAGDDIINSTEKGQDVTITGQATGLASGTTVTVSLNGHQYSATVDDKGNWSTIVPAADVANLGEAIYSVSASVTNAVGNSASTSHTISVGGEAPTIIINTVAGDDVINASELAAGQTLSGKVSGAAAGDTVTVQLGGNTYTATVANDLTWSVKVSSDDLTAMGNGALTVEASVTNKTGNTGHAEHAISIDANLPGLRVDTVAGDDIINTIEHNQNLIITGSSQGIAANSALTVTINGKTYSATVLADGSWQAAVPSSDVSTWASGSMQIAVSGESSAGNPVSILHPVTVDLAEVAISINTVSGDDVLNAAEKGQDLALSGSTHEAAEGSTVTVKFAGHQYSTTVGSDGNWSVTVPAADMSELYDGTSHVEVSVTTPTGNSAQAGREILVDTVAPSLTIDNLTQDNVLNSKEAGSDQLISGSSTAQAGQTVTVSLNGKDYQTTVDAQGHWQFSVPTADLQALTDGQTTITASVADKAGNSTEATHNVQVDLQAPVITFDNVAGDNIISFAEHSQAQIISGSATGGEAGNSVVVTIAGKTYNTVLDASGNWSVGVPASVIAGLQDGTVSITATVTDSAGNVGQQSHDVVVNSAEVGLTIETVAQDDVINAAEAGQALTVQGGSTEFASGTTVTVTLNQKQYTATIDAKGHWQLEVPAADVTALKDASNYVVSVAASDSAGNSAQASHSITIDTTAPVISINTVAGDDVLNAAEQQQPLVLSGSTTAQAGQTVTVSLGDHSYTTTVKADGSWQLSVASDDLQALAQGTHSVSVSVTDLAGNEGSTSHDLTVDTQAPTITIDTVAGDDIINSDEQQAGQTFSGSSTAEAGQSVTVTFNGHSYTTTVDQDGKWSVKVSAQDLVGLHDGDYTITAVVSDKAGNPGQTTHAVTLNGDVPTITINTFATDDVVNAAEHSQPLIVSGTTTAPAGQSVTITLNGKTYTAVVDDKGNWQATISSKDIAALADAETYSLHAEVTNSIGNSGSADHSINVDITAPSMGISIDALQDDTGLSATDFITNDAKVVLNGKLSAALADDEHAEISLDGGNTWQTLTVTGNSWSFSDGRSLADGSWNYQVRVIDDAGNVGATAEQNVIVDTTAPDAASITIDAIIQDTGLSDHDFITSDTQLSVTGTLSAELGQYDHAQVSIDGGKTWVDVSVSGKTWTYVDSRTLTDGKYNYQVRVIDEAGNISGTASQVVTIDTQVPDVSKTITIDSIDQDTGLHNNDFITSDTSLTVNGSLGASLSANEYAQISVDDGKTWQNVSVIGTKWNYTDSRTLADGNYTYWVRVVDAAGNVGAFSQQQVTIDTVAPDVAEKITVDDISVDSGFDAHDYLTNHTSYVLEGSLGKALQANEYVQVSVDGGKTWVTAKVDGTSWSYAESRTLTDGVYSYQIRVIDEAGNIGSTATQKVTVDTTAPDYGISIDGISDDTGQSATDFITQDQTLTLKGSIGSVLASDERVQISLDGGQTWVDVTVNHQQWTYSDSRTLADGDYQYQVRIIDQAGNVGSVTQQTVTVDTTPPASQGTIVSYTDDQGERQGDFGSKVATDDTAPVINGTLTQAVGKGDIVQLFRDGVLLGLVTMTDSTHWTYQESNLSDGKHSYFVRVMDLAGNYTDSTGFDLKVDTSIPTTVATVNSITTSDTTPIVNGTVSASLENGEYIQVTVGGQTYTSENGGAVVVDYANNTWYLQVPNSAALAVDSYDVTAQIKSSAGNGNTTGLAHGSLVVNTDSVNTDWATASGTSNNSNMLIGMNSQGQWTIGANSQLYNGTDLSSYDDNVLTGTRGSTLVNMTGADVNRSGVQTLYGTENTYANSTQIVWTFDGSNYNGSQLAMGTTIWYGGVMAYDRTGDGYLDLAYGDAGMDSLTYLNNNKGVLTPDGTGGESSFYGQFDSGREISGVDLNNDGTVDIVQHTNRGGAYTLTVITNKGDGTLAIGQDVTNVFVGNGANSNNAASMTWADFNGDGYMDLYIASGSKGNPGLIYYNDGKGKLASTGTAVETNAAATQGYLSAAVDWNGDGQTDIIKLSTYGGSQTATLFTNNNHGASFSASNLASKLVNVTGMATMDYDWNGTQDLLVSQQNGKVVLIQNNNQIADGTAMHLRIVDSEGINVFYGNTVNLYNSAGKLVASQIINAQSGIGVNDTSALVSFYGLNPNDTYSAQLVKITNGKSDNVTWDNLEAGNGKESYSLTADAATGGHSGTLSGTGYNDTFVAEEGSYTYNGGGGWTTSSDHDSWSTTGGVDVVDYRNATSGVNVDLSISSAQDTGFNTSRLVNIEGINGSDFNDVITGSKGDNQFEGRGGNDTFNIGNGGHDTMLYKLINSADATGGNGSDVVNGFTVGSWESTADTDRIDLRELLSGSGYKGDGSASYVDGVATIGASAGNITDYLHVVHNGSNTEIQIDRDGTGSQFDATTVVTLNGVQTDLATLLANHQLLVV